LEFQKNSWGALRNIEVSAVRGKQIFSLITYEEIIEKLLKSSLVTHISPRSLWDVAESELVMLEVWKREWRGAYLHAVN